MHKSHLVTASTAIAISIFACSAPVDNEVDRNETTSLDDEQSVVPATAAAATARADHEQPAPFVLDAEDADREQLLPPSSSVAKASAQAKTNAAQALCWAGGETSVGTAGWFGGYGGNPNAWINATTTGVGCGSRLQYAFRATGKNAHISRIEFAWYSPTQQDLLFRNGENYGTTYTTGTASGSTNGWQYCPTNSVIVGMRGYHDGVIASVGFTCKDLITGALTHLPIQGSAASTWYEYGCDWVSGAVSTNPQAASRAGYLIDGFSLKCATWTPNTVSWL